MKKIVAGLGVCALICALSAPVVGHAPEGYRGIIWQWPANQVPVRDADLSDWDRVPEEFWFTHENYNVNSSFMFDGNETKAADLDASDLSFRFIPSFVQGSSKLHWAYERFDNDWTQWDNISPAIDADHSGGTFWNIEGGTDEENLRNRNRHAQIYQVYFDDGLRKETWLWAWMSASDWHDDLPWGDGVYEYEGTPGNSEEFNYRGEFMFTVFDDYNHDDPNAGVEHPMMEGEIIGLNVSVDDTDGTDEGEDRNNARWNLGVPGQACCNADFLSDYLLLPIDTDIIDPTAVEEDSWANIKASFRK